MRVCVCVCERDSVCARVFVFVCVDGKDGKKQFGMEGMEETEIRNRIGNRSETGRWE